MKHSGVDVTFMRQKVNNESINNKPKPDQTIQSACFSPIVVNDSSVTNRLHKLLLQCNHSLNPSPDPQDNITKLLRN